VERKLLEGLQFSHHLASRAFEALVPSSIFAWRWVKTMFSSLASTMGFHGFNMAWNLGRQDLEEQQEVCFGIQESCTSFARYAWREL
jgi:hypothetical protein